MMEMYITMISLQVEALNKIT